MLQRGGRDGNEERKQVTKSGTSAPKDEKGEKQEYATRTADVWRR